MFDAAQIKINLGKNVLSLILAVIASQICHGENYITFHDSGRNRTSKIEVFSENDSAFFSLNQFCERSQAVIDWDYIAGTAEIKIRDRILRFTNDSPLFLINGVIHQAANPTRIRSGAIYASEDILNTIANEVFEGDLVWIPDQATLRFLGGESSGDSSRIGGDERAVVVLDAGHGGEDTGVQLPTGRFEKDLTIRILEKTGQIVRDRLGADVIFTRNGDFLVTAQDRMIAANASKADFFVSLHVSPPKELGTDGFFIYILPGDEKSETREKLPVWGETNQENKLVAFEAAEAFGGALSKAASGVTFKVKKQKIAVLKGLSMPGILLDVSWSLNFYGDISMDKESGESRAAEAIFDGMKAGLEATGAHEHASN